MALEGTIHRMAEFARSETSESDQTMSAIPGADYHNSVTRNSVTRVSANSDSVSSWTIRSSCRCPAIMALPRRSRNRIQPEVIEPCDLPARSVHELSANVMRHAWSWSVVTSGSCSSAVVRSGKAAVIVAKWCMGARSGAGQACRIGLAANGPPDGPGFGVGPARASSRCRGSGMLNVPRASLI